jgi:hypothetical protein
MRKSYYQGKYRPKNTEKYIGDYTNVIYRSSWELKFMSYCDLNPNVLKYSSEEVVIPYKSPLDGKVHRYFVDFYVRMRDKDGEIRDYLIEIKPKRFLVPPKKTAKKSTKTYANEMSEFVKNQAKWEAAKKFCNSKQLTFKILTEENLF